MKILLVDDDAFLRDMYEIKFNEAGHKVSVAKNTFEALSLLEGEEKFDVVILDMVMPGMNGVDLLKQAKKVQSYGGTKYVVLSNQGEQSDIEIAKAAGAIGYIIKAECIPSEVVKKIEKLIK